MNITKGSQKNDCSVKHGSVSDNCQIMETILAEIIRITRLLINIIDSL
jgi:hypothetical protein